MAGEAKPRFVCGYMECDRELCKTFLGGLPPVFKVNIRNDAAGQWLENSIKFSPGKRAANRAGSDAVLARLSEALFGKRCAVTCRICRKQQTGWLAGARDSGGGSGVGAHASRSGHPWTIAGSCPSGWACHGPCWPSGSGISWANRR